MRALTLHQPWAQLVVLGVKRFETRSWGTAFRGRLAIHASRTRHPEIPPPLRALCADLGLELETLPMGAVLGVAELVGGGVILADQEGPYILNEDRTGPRIIRPTALDLATGNYAAKRRAWFLHDASAFAAPVAARGQQGLWRWGG